ncbi:uncharacterized protein LOC122510104 [Leptopilina heterotoma]|uniref:uncharacterized protein LOC122510104 n=1 Tax=Leptopilina heterotoma TaxID=63436 RepID=UPI001CAA167B|nr:uncharacterized protein LOC122510104 [Leptopilina heterotoma]
MSALRNFTFSILFYVLLLLQGLLSTPANIPLSSISDQLVESALISLNVNSPNHRVYKKAELISAQKTFEPPFVIYQLVLKLDPVCKEETCMPETCSIEIKQDDQGSTVINYSSILCLNLDPYVPPPVFSPNVETQPTDQEVMESLEKQMKDNLSFDHEVQTSADHNDRPFIAVPASKSHYCPGCPYNLNPNLPGLAAFGEQIVNSMDESLAGDYKHKVVQVLRVSRSVPPNANVVRYELLLEIGETNCLKTSHVERSQCVLHANIPVRTCQVTLEEKPWQKNSLRITKNNCTGTTLENELNVSLGPNSAVELFESPNKEVEEEVKTEFYDQVAQEGKYSTYETMIDQYFESPGLNLTIERDDGTVQTVVVEEPSKKVAIKKDCNMPEKSKGFVDKVKEFDAFLEGFDVPLKEPSSTPKDDRIPVEEEIIKPIRIENPESIRVRRDTKEDLVNVRDELLEKKLARKVVTLLDDEDSDSMKDVVMKVLDAKKEKRNGGNFYLKLKVATTTCNEAELDFFDERSCLKDIVYPIKVCKVQFSTDEKNPLKDLKIIQSECLESEAKSRRRRERVGSAKPLDVNDSDLQGFVNMALDNYSQNLKKTYEPVVVKVISASVQVVSGQLYTIRAQLGESNCAKGTKGNCLFKTDGESEECVFKIWSQPWTKKAPEITYKCGPERRKRLVKREVPQNMPGSERPKNVNDPEIKKYADFGLQKYSQNLQKSYEPLVAEVISASAQTVAGTIYKIKVKFAESNCAKGTKENCLLKTDGESEECLLEIWSKPWEDKGKPQVDVKCGPDRKKRSLRGQNYSQKMLDMFKEAREESTKLNSDQSFQKVEEATDEFQGEGQGRLKGQGYQQKMMKQSEELRKEQETFELESTMFQDFVQSFQKVYTNNSEKQKRFKIFQQNLKTIDELRRLEQGTGEYGVTMFADLSHEEFRSTYLGLRPDLHNENEIPFPMAKIPDVELPSEFDWTTKGAVSEVKDQGSCGSCWAFAVTGNIEGQYAIKHGKLVSLSEQELLDCDKLDEGCNGGLPDSAYRAIESLGGLELESDYPYDAEVETCQFKKSKAKVQVASAVNITSNETQMAQWLIENGPIAIGINANAMQFYMGGISHPPKFLCNPKNLDHGVLIVGYGVHTYPIFKKTLPYWKIKNSWGPRWGEKGYYRVYRGGSTCGLNQMASSSVVM